MGHMTQRVAISKRIILKTLESDWIIVEEIHTKSKNRKGINIKEIRHYNPAGLIGGNSFISLITYFRYLGSRMVAIFTTVSLATSQTSSDWLSLTFIARATITRVN